MKQCFLSSGLFAALAATCVASPELLFYPSELPALRKRLAEPAQARIWQDIKSRAEIQLGLDPAKVDEVKGKPRIQVLAHQYGRRLTDWVETLGFAYQVTGDERYGRKGSELLAAMARKLPAADRRVAKAFAGARGDLIRGFAIGLDWLDAAMTDDERKLVEETGADYIRFLLREAANPKTWWMPYHNFMGVALGAAGTLSLKLQDRFPAEAPGWTRKCADQVERWFNQGFDADGAYYEGTLYGQYGLSNAILFANALKRLRNRDLFQHPHLRMIPGFYAASILPGEAVLDARNDANYNGLSDPFMLRLAAAWNDGLARWVWNRVGKPRSPLAIVWANDVRPRPPSEKLLAKLFRGRGLCVFRTGWEKTDVMFSVESGKYHAVTHNQGDKGCFTLYGLGSRWAIDSGYGNKREPRGRDQTVAHNGVLIDGKSQALSGAGAGTDGRILAYGWNADRGYVLCDMAEAYRRNNKGWKNVPVSRALRHCLFVRPRDGLPAYVVTMDDFLVDEHPHDYEWLLHTSDSNRIELNARGAVIRPFAVSGTGYVTAFEEKESEGTCKLSFEVREPGVYSVWARVRAGGDKPGKSDSFFVSMDGGKPGAWHMGSGTSWHWARVARGPTFEPRSFTLTKGRHVLDFATREPRAHLDAVAIVPGTGDVPVFTAPQAILLEAENGEITAPMTIVSVPPPTRNPRLEVLLDAATDYAASRDSYDGHPRLKIHARAVSPEFVAVLLPLPSDIPTPEISFSRQKDCHLTRIRWPTREDRIEWRPLTLEQPVLRQTRR